MVRDRFQHTHDGWVLSVHFSCLPILLHIMEGNSLTSENWKAFDLAWKLKTNGGFSEEEWTTQIGGYISVIVNSARPNPSIEIRTWPIRTGARVAAANKP